MITGYKRSDASIETPPAGKVTFFISSSGTPRAKKEDGTFTDFTGPTGATGPQGPAGTNAVHRAAVQGSDSSTTSTSDVLLSGMQLLNVPAGTYLSLFSGSTVNSGNGAERNYFSIYINGVKWESQETKAGIAGGAYSPVSINDTIVLTTTSTVEIRWRVVAGTGTVSDRRFNLVKVA